MRLFIPAMVVAEATYLVGTRLRAAIESEFLAGLADFDVQAPAPEDWGRIAELVLQYGDFPLGGAGASVIVLAERRVAFLRPNSQSAGDGIIPDSSGRADRYSVSTPA
jgi:hypothetical protein